MRTPIHLSLAICAAIVASTASGGPLVEARINKIINEVSVVRPSGDARSARLNEVVGGDVGVKTGVKSRSELLFQDDTLTRIGPDSYFTFKAGTRDITLDEGTMLLQVPKGLGGAKIRTAAVTAAITGTTILLEHRPKQNIKVLVLEGSLRLSANGTFGDSVLLEAGKMVIMPANAKRIPDPVSVDLKTVLKTSSLVNMGGNKNTAALPSLPLIEKAIEVQQQQKDRNGLVDTNLVILGNGSNVVLAPDAVITALDRNADISTALVSATKPDAEPPVPVPTPAATPASTPAVDVPPQPTATPAVEPTATPVPVDPLPTPTPSVAPTASPTPAASATPQPSATPTLADDDEDDDDDSDYDEVVDKDGKDVTIDTPTDLSTGGRAGKLKIRADGTVTVKSTVKVSDSAPGNRSTRGGSISIRSRQQNGVAIAIRNSAQLLSLLDAAAAGPGGKIIFRSAGGAVNVTGATIQADRGKIEMRNEGNEGAITLQNATLSANTIKLHALGQDGQLNIGGGSISADAVIDLYAAGSNGQVNFTDNVTLSGGSVKTISGHSVTIANDKTVTVSGSGPANVFTNNPNYTGSGGNGSTSGRFDGAGATTQPFSARPGGG